MKKTIIKILSVVAIIIVFFIIGLQISNIFINSSTEETDAQKEEESTQNITTITETSSPEELSINSDKEATKKNSFVGTITEVDIANKQIIVENPSHLVIDEIYKGDKEWINNHKVMIGEKTYVKVGYLLSLNNVQIKEDNGNKLEIRNLKVGDTIKVNTKNIEYVNKLIFEPITSDHIVLIERKK